MELTDDELSRLHTIMNDECYYRDDEVTYGDSETARLTHSIMDRLTEEAKRRGLWWAK